MSSASASPKRRHILSSINPESIPPQHHPVDGEHATDPSPDDHGADSEPRKRTRRLRLKGEKRRHDTDGASHHRHHRRRRREPRSPTPPNPYDPPPLDADAAFRESLFDALADDEGASYWQGVYGQPMHVYSPDRAGPQGELERMTDEEYAAHVRQRMWEKTHAGLLEERARREQERARHAEEHKAEARRNRRLAEEMERSLRRGERRRWAARWEAYLRAWAGWDGSAEAMSWPVEGGSRPARGIDEAPVRDFFVLGLDRERADPAEFAARLRDERVRWHPDKMQQRLAGRADAAVLRDVTAVFQVIDRLWSER